MISLRPYQLEALAAYRAEVAKGVRRSVINLPTGCGKTVLGLALARELGVRCLWLAHRDELLTQPARTLRALWPEAEAGIVKAEHNDAGARDFVFASVQTVCREHRRQQLGQFGLVVVDECFPAGTLVDGKPIESIRVGDDVTTYRDGVLSVRRVTHVFKSRPSALVRVQAATGSVTCTPGHPFLTRRGWVEASLLTASDEVLREQQDLPVLSTTNESTNSSDVRVVQDDEAGGAAQDRDLAMRGVPHAGGVPRGEARVGSQGAGLLLGGTQETISLRPALTGNGCDKSQVCFKENAGTEPDGIGECAGKDARIAPSDWPRAIGSRRQRQGTNKTADNAGLGPGMGDGSLRADDTAAQFRVPDLLQARRGEPRLDDRNRGRRRQPLLASEQGQGREEGSSLVWVGVDCVEVLEPGCDGEFGGLCPGGHVYNLEVEDWHTYIAGGFVVHNCHHSSATSYNDTLEALGCYTDTGPLVAGLTATPERTDQVALDNVFQSIAYQYQLPRAIAEGYLVPPRVVERRIKLDLDKVAYRAGEWSGGALDEAMLAADIVGNVSAAVREHCADRKTLVYTVSVGQAKAIAERLAADGMLAASIDGETPTEERRDILARFKSGSITHLANCSILTEGFDEPSVGAVVLARPTTSKSLYIQIVGRGLRIHPGKTECLVVDLVGVSKRHTLVQASTLFGRLLSDEREQPEQKERDPEIKSTWYADRLLAQVRGVPASRSRLVWVRPHDRAWVVGLADYGTVVVEQRGDGWTVRVQGRSGGPINEWLCPTPVDLELAIGIGEDYARRCGVCNLLDKEAAWRSGMPTEKQIKALRRYGINTVPATSGEASSMISAHLATQDLEPASSKQLWYLRSRGLLDRHQTISKREAGRLIARSRARS